MGYAYPSQYADMFRDIIENVPGADGVVFSTHCHNDLGLAVANSLEGVMGGARQVECTINGLGERAGNAAMEEIVMAIRTRADALKVHTGIVTEHITSVPLRLGHHRLSGAVQQGDRRQERLRPRGRHPPGRDAEGPRHLRVMQPQDVGQAATNLVMGKHSGRAAFRDKLKGLGYEPGQNALNDAFVRFKELADKKKDVYDDDIIALVDDALAKGAERIKIERLRVVAAPRVLRKPT